MRALLYTKHSGLPLPALPLHLGTHYSIFIMRSIDRIGATLSRHLFQSFEIDMPSRENMKRRRRRKGGGVGEKKCISVTRFCASTHFECAFFLVTGYATHAGIHWNYCNEKRKELWKTPEMAWNETQAHRLTNHKMVAFSWLPNHNENPLLCFGFINNSFPLFNLALPS